MRLEDVDPFSAAFQQDPFPFYDAMRDASPAYRFPRSDLYFVTRYATVSAVLRDPTTFSSRFGTPAERPKPHLAAELKAIADQGWPRVSTLLTADPPEHTRYRNTVGRAFNARTVAAFRPAIEAIVDETIDACIDQVHVDVQRSLAIPVPVRVIARVLALPDERRADIKRWSDDATSSIGADVSDERRVEAQWGMLELQRFMHEQLEDRRLAPREDILTTLVQAELPVDAADRHQGTRLLEEPELLGILQQLIGAGNETTTKLINEMIRLLGQHHEEWWKAKADPSRIPAVVEESLRMASPTQAMYRVATTDTELDGVPIPAGARLVLVYGAANRDQTVFPDPGRFDPDRQNVRDHLAFGLGVHFCIGAPLSRLETAITLERLTTRWDDFTLSDANTFEYEASFMLRGLKDLFVDVVPAR
jgi:cytochrome P450